MFGNKKKREKAANLVASGSRAVGTISDVEDTGMTINDNPRVRIRFRVEPLDGSAAFDAEKTQTVSRVQIPQIGQRYPIFFDPADPSSFAYATVDDEQGRASIVSMFGDAFGADASGVGQTAAAAAQAAPTAATAAAPDPLDQLKKLAELRDAGVLSDAEFEAKKSELLGSV
jgi:Short C-terminal domain